jgi:hypothetical protein
MRTYIGTIDPASGHPRVTIAEIPDVSTANLADLIEDLGELSWLRLNGAEPSPAQTAGWKRRLVDDLRRGESGRPLPHLVVHSPAGFGWGYAGNGPADLAHSILHRELAETVPRAVYLRFRDDVITALPRDGFRLPAADVWDWIRANRTLVDQHVFGAAAEATGPPAAVGLRF